MGSESKKILCVAAAVVVGLALGSVMAGPFADLGEFLRGSIGDLSRWIFTPNEAPKAALTPGLAAVSFRMIERAQIPTNRRRMLMDKDRSS